MTQPVKNNPGMVFMVMSNELSTPKILFCPSDTMHATGGAATNFSGGDLLGTTIPAPPALTPKQTSAGKISYFVNGDASESNPQDVMIGDFNIGNSTPATGGGASSWAFNQTAVGSTSTRVFSLVLDGKAWTTTAAGSWAWTANDLHQKSGNLGLADGSCQSASVKGLQDYLRNATNNASSLGAFNFPW